MNNLLKSYFHRTTQISVKHLLLKNHIFPCVIWDCQVCRSDGHPIPSIRKGPWGPAELQAEQRSAAYPCAEGGWLHARQPLPKHSWQSEGGAVLVRPHLRPGAPQDERHMDIDRVSKAGVWCTHFQLWRSPSCLDNWRHQSHKHYLNRTAELFCASGNVHEVRQHAPSRPCKVTVLND